MKKEVIINEDSTLMFALNLMDELKRKLLIVLDEDSFVGVLSIGDIQRAIINQVSLDSKVKTVLRSIITVAKKEDSLDDIKQQMLQYRIECMPVVDKKNNLIDILFWEDVFGEDIQKVGKFNLPVIIMAGGKGTRLQPITNVIPKPLIPLGDKTMLEIIIDNFKKHGCKNFYLSVNYKSDLIKYYLNASPIEGVEINYFEEKKPLGTAGSLHLLKDKINETFFVTNCDILVDQDYSEIYNYHKENKNELTVVAAIKQISIPYGTIETGASGALESITEKPELTYLINSGLYILEPHLLSEIPKNEFFHITTLIKKLKKNNRRVGVFPVSEKSWKDIGEWKEYIKYNNIVS